MRQEGVCVAGRVGREDGAGDGLVNRCHDHEGGGGVVL